MVRWLLLVMAGIASLSATAGERRVRDLGIEIGVLAPGPLDAITDIAGVRVGQVSVHVGRRIHTGVTAIVPAPGNLRQQPLPAAVFVGNGYGKLAGLSQIDELGEIETPIVLTNTLNVAEGIAGVVEWTLAQPGNGAVRSVNAVVGETNDGFLNDIRRRYLKVGDIKRAISMARPGAVAEGAVGAGSGTVAFGWKGGIGTSSRVLPQALGGYRVGALVQTNMGGILVVDGVRVGEALGQYYLKEQLAADDRGGDGSIMIVLATDAPLSDRNLGRLAKRAIAGLARTGASMTNGSGDYVVAFSTSDKVRRTAGRGPRAIVDLPNDEMSPLFQAAAEATEEAILNSLFMAGDVEGFRGTVHALPVDEVMHLWHAAKGR